MMIYLLFYLALGLSIILILMNSLISKKKIMEREAPSPFECGFDLKTFGRSPFSIRFFLIAIIFLIFDVEITLLVPLPVILSAFNLNSLISISMIFVVVLIFGLFHEWNEGSLHWK